MLPGGVKPEERGPFPMHSPDLTLRKDHLRVFVCDRQHIMRFSGLCVVGCLQSAVRCSVFCAGPKVFSLVLRRVCGVFQLGSFFVALAQLC